MSATLYPLASWILMNDAPAPDHSADDQPVYYTARHLLHALQHMDDRLLDYPLVLIHGKQLHKPKLIHGLLPTPTPIDQETVESKPPSLLTLGELVDLSPDGPAGD